MKNEHSFQEAKKIFCLPFMELLYQAQKIHRDNFNPSAIQISSLLNIKTGNCSENCAYCSQSLHHKTGLKSTHMMSLDTVIEAAKRAKEVGCTRFCMGAAGRSPREAELDLVCKMVREVKKIGLETCVTLGLLTDEQVHALKKAGLDYYNHNIDTSIEFYSKIITTRTFQDRLDTLERLRMAGIKLCCGGIIGMGETNDDRIKMLITLANLPQPPESVPLNKLIKIPGTPLENTKDIDPFDFIRTIALARILMPTSYIRLSAGRQQMSDELQALCFIAGANSIFYGDMLLTAGNALPDKDNLLFQRLGLERLDEQHALVTTAKDHPL
jgi:biotin synthase